MRIRSKLTTVALSTGMVVAGFAGLATPAQAAPGDTTATFTITAGSLSISVPATANLASVTAGAATASGSLGTVTVTDNRGILAATWTSSVISTAFANGGTTIPATSVTYSSGSATTSSVGAFVPSVALPIVGAGTAGSWAGTGSNAVSWNPTVTIALPTTQVVGAYSATVNHSVA